jgi:hypothetical protein
VDEWETLTLADRLTARKSGSPDGHFILYAQIYAAMDADLRAIPVEANAKPFRVVQTPAKEDQGQFSLDGPRAFRSALVPARS